MTVYDGVEPRSNTSYPIMSKVLPPSSTDTSSFDGTNYTPGMPTAEFDGTVARGRTLGGDVSSVHTHPTDDIVSGIMATARLGSGTADSSSFLRGDSTWTNMDAQTLSIDGQTLTISNGNDVTLPDLNTTYDLLTLTDSGAVKVRLTGSDSTNDDVTIAGTGVTSVTQTGSTITVNSDAEVNVQSDWDQTTDTEDDFIKNKPTTISTTQASAIAVNSTHSASAHAPAGAEVNVQSDWDQTTDTEDDFIKNKPGQFTTSVDGFVPAADGTNESTKFLRGDATWQAVSGTGDITTDDEWDVKGDLIVATGDNAAGRLPIGTTNGHVLTVDSTNATYGLKWSAATATGSGHAIQDEGDDVDNPRDDLNFVGELVTAVDNATDASTDVTIDAKTLWLYAA